MLYDWSKAPPEAQFIAKDANGKVYWYENKPTLGLYTWNAVGAAGPVDSVVVAFESFESSLEERPGSGMKTDTLPPANTYQVGGTHYAKPIQPWDAITAWGLGFLDGNAVKYLARWRSKGGLQDLEKAKHYIEKQIETERAKGAAT